MTTPQPDHNHEINPQLLQAARWLVHRHKKPFYANGKPRSGTLDSPEDLAKLATYAAALETLNGRKKFSGLGFAVNDGIQFVDLDDVRDPETGEYLLPWVQAVVDAAKRLGAFIEVSMSGTGLHILGYGVGKFPTMKQPPVETYSHGRYCALGRATINVGTVPLPDLAPLLPLMEVAEDRPQKAKPALRLVTGRVPMTWPEDKARLPAMLKVLNPDMDYPDWINVGMAIHDASGGTAEGLAFWEDWSAEGDKWVEGETLKMWNGFKPGGGITMGTVVHMYQQVLEEIPSPVITPAPVSTRRKEFNDDELMSVTHPDIPWMVDQLICPGLTLLAAPPKMGKSYFVLQMALCVGAGKPFLGRKTRQVKVSYFDLEEWEELLQRRRKDIGAGNSITKTQVRYAMETTGGDVTVLDDIQRHINGGSELIIIDLLARVRDEMNEDAKKNAYARDYATLRKFSDMILQQNPHVAIVMVHHTNKGQHEDWQSKISGSQGLAGASHTNMLLATVDLRGMDDETRKQALNFRRLHVAGKAVAPDEVMLEMMQNGGGWQVSTKTPDEVKMQSKHAHILQVLHEANGAWVTAKEVHAEVEGTLDSIKKQLMRMAKKGEIVSAGSGGQGYCIPVR